jgi:hypothetical protein
MSVRVANLEISKIAAELIGPCEEVDVSLSVLTCRGRLEERSKSKFNRGCRKRVSIRGSRVGLTGQSHRVEDFFRAASGGQAPSSTIGLDPIA